jgi:hypothetical protein
MRAWRLWVAAVPELGKHKRIHFLRNARNPTLSSGNLDSYTQLFARMQAVA